MILDEIVSWYQKKIGTYDKEGWEKTVEQMCRNGTYNSSTLKTAKLKPELIDVDLVRGSTFPKAKPKQSLLTVIRLAILRYLLLPLYSQWWVKQTSPNAFGLLFFLYITQLINLAFYTLNESRLEGATSTVAEADESGGIITQSNINQTPKSNTTGDKSEFEHIVSLSELLIPMILSLFLSLIHSQIVATNTIPNGVKCKRRRYSNTSQNGRQGKFRRRKKLVKLRSHDLLESSSNLNAAIPTLQQKTASAKKYTSGVNEINVNPNLSSNSCGAQIQTGPSSSLKRDVLVTEVPCAPRTTSTRPPYLSPLKLDLNDSMKNVKSEELLDVNDVGCSLRKRNVNWHSPVHKYATSTQEKQQQTSPQSVSTTSSTSQLGENSSVSSNSPSISPKKNVRINDSIQEFYYDVIERAVEQKVKSEHQPEESPANVVRDQNVESNNKDDDGFESLNGKSSSGEETNASPHVLRLHLNIAGNNQSVQQLTEPTQTCYERIAIPQHMTESSQLKTRKVSSDETEDDGDDDEIISSPASQANTSNCNECTTSATEWMGITTNSDECSYSSDYDNSDDYKGNHYSDENGSDLDFTPTTILNPHGTSDRISCTVWDHREIKKAQMSVLEISSAIIENVESMPETNDYIYIGIFFSVILSLIPCFCRLCEVTMDSENSSELNYLDLPMILWEKASFSITAIFRFAFGDTLCVILFVQRLCLTLILFMIFSVAERTFKQRFMYAKLFSHLTSSRRARKSNLPHFRLNKVRKIKTWLSVRSYLKKRGPQRSVDIIVSAAFIVTLLLLAFLSVEWLKDSVHLHSHLNLEALLWSSTIGIFLLRFMTLGNKIHHKYRSVSVLITEQINLYLQIEKKPKKKEELMVSNSVLKLASDLLKELETPFKISGLSANPYLFTTIKVVILSALSGVLSEMLGFKLKLHKIKIK